MNIIYEGYKFHGYYIIPSASDISYGLVYECIQEPSESIYFKFLPRSNYCPVNHNLLIYEHNLDNIFGEVNKVNQLILDMSIKFHVDVSLLKVPI
jgi:hypothetical protein